MDITNSETTAFRACPAMHGYRYIERLELDRERATAASWGTLGHAGMEAAWKYAWQQRESQGEKPSFNKVLSVAKAAAEARAQQYIDSMPEDDQWGTQEEEAEAIRRQAIELGEVLPITLRRCWRAICTHKFIAAEYTYKFPLPWGDNYEGQIDLITYDPEADRLVVWDHKFTASVDAYEGRLQLDTQCVGYMWAVRQTGWTGAKEASNFVWSLTRRKKPSTPRVLKLSKKAAADFSNKENGAALLAQQETSGEPQGLVSAAACDTLPEVYEEALLEQELVRLTNRTLEQEERLKQIVSGDQKWYRQEEHYINDAAIARWLSELQVDAERMKQATANEAYRTRNPGNCASPQSYKCDYRDVCLSDAPETRALYRIRKSKHAELSAESENK